MSRPVISDEDLSGFAALHDRLNGERASWRITVDSGDLRPAVRFPESGHVVTAGADTLRALVTALAAELVVAAMPAGPSS